MENLPHTVPFAAARFIKEIGRGKKGARSLSRDDAFQLYAAMLDGRVADLELGGLMLAMRIKGESTEELAGFLDRNTGLRRWPFHVEVSRLSSRPHA